MSDIEQMTASLPRLKHLELHADCNNDVVNGERWRMQVKNLVTFNFKFRLSAELVSEDLDSFRTSFRVQQKRWFVAYANRRLFSVPHFCVSETDGRFEPLYSTVPDNGIFYDCIKQLELREIFDSFDHQFNHVETLILYYPCLLSTIDKIVKLSQVQHLILHPSMAYFSVEGLIMKMSNVRYITIPYDPNTFIEQFRGTILDQIQALVIRHSDTDLNDFCIEQLCRMFPKTKHVRLYQTCSIMQMSDFLYRFKHLSTAYFHYTAYHVARKDAQACRLKIQSALDRAPYFQRLNYTCRFDFVAVHFWI